MNELEDRLRRGHPEEREHRPVPFEEVAARPRPSARQGNRRLRVATLLAAAFAVFAVAILGQPLGLRESATSDGDPRGAVAPSIPSLGFSGRASPPVPAAVAAPLVECGPAAEPECLVVVEAVQEAAGEELAKVELLSYSDSCNGPDPCGSPVGGWNVETVTRLAGPAVGWVCDAADESASCRTAAPILTLTVEGARDQAVMLYGDGGTQRSLVADPTVEQVLPVGRWRLTVPGQGCDTACLTRAEAWDGSPPPGGCTTELDAAGGRRYAVTVRILDPEPCEIEVR